MASAHLVLFLLWQVKKWAYCVIRATDLFSFLGLVKEISQAKRLVLILSRCNEVSVWKEKSWSVAEEHDSTLCCVSGGGGDQHPATGSVSQRETLHRAEEETGPQPAHWIKAEPQQELARRPDLQCVCIHQTGSIRHRRQNTYFDLVLMTVKIQVYIWPQCIVIKATLIFCFSFENKQ